MARHRHQEFIRFLNKINRETPAGRELHLIVNNYATHTHPKVRAWLERHSRFHFHFTPTSASWLNAVEGFFAKLTRQRLKRGVFKGIVDLQAAINQYLAETNDNPKPFTWSADPDAIIEKVRRGKQRWSRPLAVAHPCSLSPGPCRCASSRWKPDAVAPSWPTAEIAATHGAADVSGVRFTFIARSPSLRDWAGDAGPGR
jgi:transposase